MFRELVLVVQLQTESGPHTPFRTAVKHRGQGRPGWEREGRAALGKVTLWLAPFASLGAAPDFD